MYAVVAVLRPAGENDAVAMGGTGVHGSAGRGDREDSAVNVIGRQIDDGEVRFYPVRNEQAPSDHLAMAVAFTMVVVVFFAVVVVVFFAVIVMCVGPGELDRIDSVTERDNLGLVRTRVVQEISQPIGLQAETDGQHDGRIRHPGNVARSRLECVGIATRLQQAEDLHPVATYHPSQSATKLVVATTWTGGAAGVGVSGATLAVATTWAGGAVGAVVSGATVVSWSSVQATRRAIANTTRPTANVWARRPKVPIAIQYQAHSKFSFLLVRSDGFKMIYRLSIFDIM